jgi:hypothetical protein
MQNPTGGGPTKKGRPMFEWDAGMGSSVCENCGSSKSVGCDCCPFVVAAAGFTKQGPGCPAPLFTFSVTDTAGRSFQVSRSASEFESLHARLCEYGEVHDVLPPPRTLLLLSLAFLLLLLLVMLLLILSCSPGEPGDWRRIACPKHPPPPRAPSPSPSPPPPPIILFSFFPFFPFLAWRLEEEERGLHPWPPVTLLCCTRNPKPMQASELPKLPGKKMLNSNTTAHLSKRVGRYGDYLSAVLALKWAAQLPTVASFLTDEGLRTAGVSGAAQSAPASASKSGSDGGQSSSRRAEGGNGAEGGGVCGWVDVEQEIGVEQAALMAEVAALRRRVEKLDKMHASWSRTLQQLLFVTLFHPRRKEEHRCEGGGGARGNGHQHAQIVLQVSQISQTSQTSQVFRILNTDISRFPFHISHFPFPISISHWR